MAISSIFFFSKGTASLSSSDLDGVYRSSKVRMGETVGTDWLVFSSLSNLSALSLRSTMACSRPTNTWLTLTLLIRWATAAGEFLTEIGNTVYPALSMAISRVEYDIVSVIWNVRFRRCIEVQWLLTRSRQYSYHWCSPRHSLTPTHFLANESSASQDSLCRTSPSDCLEFPILSGINKYWVFRRML